MKGSSGHTHPDRATRNVGYHPVLTGWVECGPAADMFASRSSRFRQMQCPLHDDDAASTDMHRGRGAGTL